MTGRTWVLIAGLLQVLPVAAGEIDGKAVLGGALGGAAGTALGSALGGREGAMLGGALGAGVGAAIGAEKRGYQGSQEYRGAAYREAGEHGFRAGPPYGRAHGHWKKRHKHDD